MKSTKALYISTLDREDGGSMGFRLAIQIPEEITNFEDAINHLKPTLTSLDFKIQLVEEDGIRVPEDLMEDGSEEVFDIEHFHCVYVGYRNYRLEVDFEYFGPNEDYKGEIFTIEKDLDFIEVKTTLTVGA